MGGSNANKVQFTGSKAIYLKQDTDTFAYYKCQLEHLQRRMLAC